MTQAKPKLAQAYISYFFVFQDHSYEEIVEQISNLEGKWITKHDLTMRVDDYVGKLGKTPVITYVVLFQHEYEHPVQRLVFSPKYKLPDTKH